MTTTNRALENQVENTLQPGVAFNHLADVLDRQYGSVTVDFAADAALTLTQAQCDHGVLVLTDSGAVLTGAKNVTLTDAFPPKLVVNETAQTLTLLRSVGTGVVLAAGETALIGCGPDDVMALAGGGGGGVPDADAVAFDNAASGLAAFNVQDAIDEVAAALVVEYGVHVIKDSGVDAGGYPAARSVPRAMTLTRFYAEVTGTTAAIEVFVNGVSVHGPVTVTTSNTSAVSIPVAAGDEIGFDIFNVTATRVWAQIDGVAA